MNCRTDKNSDSKTNNMKRRQGRGRILALLLVAAMALGQPVFASTANASEETAGTPMTEQSVSEAVTSESTVTQETPAPEEEVVSASSSDDGTEETVTPEPSAPPETPAPADAGTGLVPAPGEETVPGGEKPAAEEDEDGKDTEDLEEDEKDEADRKMTKTRIPGRI